jgi:signal transduction histidine kinase
MKLDKFIFQNMETILIEWENFARGIQPSGGDMNVGELRDHAGEMLKTMALDLATPQTEHKRMEKSKGNKPRLKGETAPETHADDRWTSGFSIDLLAAEYRALRASVLRLWLQESRYNSDEVEDVIRFNEAVDQALAESVTRYSEAVQTAQDVLLGILGHDLRTPLQFLGNSAQYLIHAPNDSRQAELGARMYNSVIRMKSMLDNLLDFTQSRIGGSLRISPKDTDLAEVSTQVVAEFQPSCPSRVIHHEVSGDCRGEWDASRIGQVYQNLISNALQYGSPESALVVSTRGSLQEVVLSVHNEGRPIPEQELEHIFGLLHRHAEKDTLNTNLGLGLYITREIVKAHQGTIDVISNQAEGTTFIVRLPKKQDSLRFETPVKNQNEYHRSRSIR